MEREAELLKEQNCTTKAIKKLLVIVSSRANILLGFEQKKPYLYQQILINKLGQVDS